MRFLGIGRLLSTIPSGLAWLGKSLFNSSEDLDQWDRELVALRTIYDNIVNRNAIDTSWDTWATNRLSMFKNKLAGYSYDEVTMNGIWQKLKRVAGSSLNAFGLRFILHYLFGTGGDHAPDSSSISESLSLGLGHIGGHAAASLIGGSGASVGAMT